MLVEYVYLNVVLFAPVSGHNSQLVLLAFSCTVRSSQDTNYRGYSKGTVPQPTIRQQT